MALKLVLIEYDDHSSSVLDDPKPLHGFGDIGGAGSSHPNHVCDEYLREREVLTGQVVHAGQRPA